MALDGIIIGWETGLTLQVHGLLCLSHLPFSEDLHGKDQVTASHWPWAWTRNQSRVFRVRRALRNRYMAHCFFKLKPWNKGNNTFGKSGWRGSFSWKKKKEEENGKAFYFQKSLSSDSFVILKTGKNDATRTHIVLYSVSSLSSRKFMLTFSDNREAKAFKTLFQFPWNVI